MLIYCENNWQNCEHAKKLEQMYKRIEEGSDMAKEKHIDKVQEQAKEIKKLLKMLDRAEQRLEEKEQVIAKLKEKRNMIEEHYKVVLRRKNEEENKARKFYDLMEQQTAMYVKRFCYLMEKFNNSEFDELDFKEWAKKKVCSIQPVKENGKTVKWKAITAEVKKNGNKHKS